MHSSEERMCVALMPRTPHADAAAALQVREPIEHIIGFISSVKRSQLPFLSLPSAPLPSLSPPLPTLRVYTAHACVPKRSCDVFLLAQLPVRARVKTRV